GAHDPPPTAPNARRVGGLAPDGGTARDGDGVEARALTELVEAALSRSWRRDSTLHGDDHWRCVAATGLALAHRVDGVDRTLVFCFGLLHDARRETDSFDPEHGPRAASLAGTLRDEGALTLDDDRFERLAPGPVRPTQRTASAGPSGATHTG